MSGELSDKERTPHKVLEAGKYPLNIFVNEFLSVAVEKDTAPIPLTPTVYYQFLYIYWFLKWITHVL